MRRRLGLVAVAGIALLAFAGTAWAQFTPEQFDAALAPQSEYSFVAERLITVVIAAAAGFAIGLFFSPLLGPVRYVLAILAGIAFALFTVFSPSFLAASLNYFTALYLFIVTLVFGLSFGIGRARAKYRRAQEADRPTSLGSAMWADEAHLRTANLLAGDGFLLGRFQSGGSTWPLVYKGDRHLLTVAPTRSGKGVSAIIPNLLLYAGSALVIDPKGENALVTAHHRGGGREGEADAGLGQKVFVVDPWGIAAPQLGLPAACFNPLDWIDPADPDLAENAFLLADAIIPTDSQGEDRFWDEEAKALIMGIMLYVATAPEEAQARHLGRVRDIIMLGGSHFDALLEKMYAHPNPIVSSTAARTAGKDPKLRSNVMASVQAHTHFLDSPKIRASLSRSDFRFEDLKTSAVTVYLVLPADRLKTFDRWLRLLVQQAISVNARNIGQKPAKPILFMLDEMAALGRLAMVEQAFGLMAGFGMQLWGIVQDLSQLHRIYGDGWQTFISNSGVLQYFGSRDQMTADYFSALCGVTTIRIFNLAYALSETIGSVFGSSYSTSSSIGGPGSSTSGTSKSSSNSRGVSHTVSANETQRKLAYPDELMVMLKTRQIVLVENFNPITAAKLEWFNDPQLKSLGVDLQAKPAAVSAPQHPSTPRRRADLQPKKAPVSEVSGSPSATPPAHRPAAAPSSVKRSAQTMRPRPYVTGSWDPDEDRIPQSSQKSKLKAWAQIKALLIKNFGIFLFCITVLFSLLIVTRR